MARKSSDEKLKDELENEPRPPVKDEPPPAPPAEPSPQKEFDTKVVTGTVGAENVQKHGWTPAGKTGSGPSATYTFIKEK